MRLRTFAFLTACVATAWSAQDTLTLEKAYKANEKDVFNVAFQVTTAMGQADIKMVLTYTVKKVYEEGSADIESQASALKVKFNDREMDLSNRPQPVSSVRYSKYGVPLETGSLSTGAMNTNFLRMANVIPDKPLKVGQPVEVDFKDPKDEKSTIKGTVTLESLKENVGVVVSKLDVSNAQTTTPMKFVMTSNVDATTKRLIKVNGTVSNLPVQNGVAVTAVQFAMERKS